MHLIVCCDGTWNRPDDQHPTNVVLLARNLLNDWDRQMVYYDAGVGTGGRLDEAIGGATGAGLEENVSQAYRFLVENYAHGDQISVFGFSRGAFTVRSLAGLIYKCGVVDRSKPKLEDRIAKALELYRDERSPARSGVEAFRDRESITREVHAIGVWDTVGARGIPAGRLGKLYSDWKYGFHDTKLNRMVRYAFHAVALDERRDAFEPALWTQSENAEAGQVIEQVWFPGVHSDVGGGYRERGLADGALAWMQAKAKKAGLLFRDPLHYEPKPAPCDLLHDSSREWPLGKEARSFEPRDGSPGHALQRVLHRSIHLRLLGDPTYQPTNLLTGDRKPLSDPAAFVDDD